MSVDDALRIEIMMSFYGVLSVRLVLCFVIRHFANFMNPRVLNLICIQPVRCLNI